LEFDALVEKSPSRPGTPTSMPRMSLRKPSMMCWPTGQNTRLTSTYWLPTSAGNSSCNRAPEAVLKKSSSIQAVNRTGTFFSVANCPMKAGLRHITIDRMIYNTLEIGLNYIHYNDTGKRKKRSIGYP